MSLYSNLLALGFEDSDFVLFDEANGLGPQIVEWRSQRPQPQQTQLDAVTPAQRDRASKNARFKRVLESSNKDEALITWIAGKHGLTYQQALDEIKVIFEGL